MGTPCYAYWQVSAIGFVDDRVQFPKCAGCLLYSLRAGSGVRPVGAVSKLVGTQNLSLPPSMEATNAWSYTSSGNGMK